MIASSAGYSLVRTTEPATEPITTAEAKLFLRVDVTTDDSLIDSLVTAARQQIEEEIHRSLITQTWTLRMDSWPDYPAHYDRGIPLFRPPVQSVTSIQYVDTSGSTQTLAAADYRVDATTSPGRVHPVWGTVWPAIRFVTQAITVEYTAGYGDGASSIPGAILQAMRLLLGDMYELRSETMVGSRMQPTMRKAVERLLAPYRVMGL